MSELFRPRRLPLLRRAQSNGGDRRPATSLSSGVTDAATTGLPVSQESFRLQPWDSCTWEPFLAWTVAGHPLILNLGVGSKAAGVLHSGAVAMRTHRTHVAHRRSPWGCRQAWKALDGQ